ncbi:hypothetical protein HanPSC8_Chr04g0151861 [Helianthus annuus]|nr:hypothetical protein HanPSC8_Chr04g0151861 [Helianthus annuus]
MINVINPVILSWVLHLTFLVKGFIIKVKLDLGFQSELCKYHLKSYINFVETEYKNY